ncbi:MAG: LacI family DNA-binding transcriptional regulator [Lachnospiraceae bacterium]|nr:LacI family DNA-binding transcriptional regulator [Lachnospiraceae bacterium]
MTTIKDIADLAGVSRGTVDRVLNHRGDVNPKTAAKVNEIAQALNYRPNKAGLALAAQKKKYKIGVVLFGENNPFFNEVMEGVELKSEELRSYGIATMTRRVEFDAARQLTAIDELLEEGIHGLIFAPYNDISIRNKIDEMAESDIPVVTVNTDIDGSKRIAYVGSDYVQGGCIAAGLFALMTAGDVELGIITGSAGVLCHSERVRGLEETLTSSYPRIRIAGIVENHDDDIESYRVTRELLAQHPSIDALFFAATGVYGGCRAVQESGLYPKIVTFDDVPTTLDMLKDGVISATISQQTARQGSLSLDILFDFLTTGIAPERKLNYVEHTIRIRENI